MTNQDAYGKIVTGEAITGSVLEVTRESIREFAEASLDFNPLHLDDKFMEGNFGKTRFGGIIAHGMMTFALITRTMTDWLGPRGGIHRRLETRWIRPVRPGDTITAHAHVSNKLETEKGRWLLFDIDVKNQNGEMTAAGESMAEMPEPSRFPAAALTTPGGGAERAQAAGALGLDTARFENDFWKNAEKRKTWDDIVPGELRRTHPVTLTRDAIQRFARAVGDLNPLYFDGGYAQASPYGGFIAPPSIHILLMFACTSDDDWMRTPGTINAGQSWFYNVPARPGDTVTMVARALDRFVKKQRLFVIHDNVFYNQDGDVICSGRGWTIRPR
jgi:3-hydroxybutyryl-CoA dehydratase